MNIQAPRPPMGPLIEALKALLGDRLSVSAAVREQHGHDESYHATLPPDAVAFAQSTAEVAAIMRLAAQHGAPVVPFGTGTSLEGHVASIPAPMPLWAGWRPPAPRAPMRCVTARCARMCWASPSCWPTARSSSPG